MDKKQDPQINTIQMFIYKEFNRFAKKKQPPFSVNFGVKYFSEGAVFRLCNLMIKLDKSMGLGEIYPSLNK